MKYCICGSKTGRGYFLPIKISGISKPSSKFFYFSSDTYKINPMRFMTIVQK